MLTHLRIDEALASDEATQLVMNSTLYTSNKGVIPLSTDKINVLVGPAGSGKSVFLRLLAAASHCLLEGQSTSSARHIRSSTMTPYWGKVADRYGYGTTEHFLPGVSLAGSIRKAVYYCPKFLPGLESELAHSMCMGYHVKPLIPHLHNVSEGQFASFWLKTLTERVLDPGVPTLPSIPEHQRYVENDHLSVKWEKLFNTDERVLILMDEPETSLDAVQQLQLWNSLIRFNAEGHQVVMATHQFKPFLQHPQFNFIEATPDYIQDASVLLNTWL